MPKSKTYLPDVNVWLALTSRRHIHNSRAAMWLEQVDHEHIAFCRITQMGLLRLLTNARVMGPDVISQAGAWNAYEQIRLDARVVFVEEPAGVESVWRKYSQSADPAPQLWTDAYLLAFAERRDLRLVTFDKGLHNRAPDDVLLLSA